MQVFFDITETKLFNDDDDNFWLSRDNFDSNDEYMENVRDKKYEYYSSDFWYDCDYIKIKWKWTFRFCEVDDEIIVDSTGMFNDEIVYSEDMPIDIIEKYLLLFFSDDWENEKYIDIDMDGMDWNAKAIWTDDIDVVIKYRGWSWYTYSFHWYSF